MRGGGEGVELPFKHRPSSGKRALRDHLGFSNLQTPNFINLATPLNTLVTI